MIKKLSLLGLAALANAQDEADLQPEVTVQAVKCNGEDNITVDFTVDFKRSEAVMASMTLGQYQCKYDMLLDQHSSFSESITNDDSANGIRSYQIIYNPYHCTDDPEDVPTRTTMESFSVQPTVRFHTMVNFQVGNNVQSFATTALDFTAGCEFSNFYDITSHPMSLQEEDLKVTFDQFRPTGDDFEIDLSNENIIANEKIYADFSVKAGSPFSVLGPNVGFAPQKCSIKTSYDTEEGSGFELYNINASDAKCGYQQLLFSLQEQDSGAFREWQMSYIAFVLNDPQGAAYTGIYSLECTISVCLVANFNDANHDCAEAVACF